jgi:putative nucleotidyltransferase with HDIG domain
MNNKILVVDDELVMRQMLQDLLTRQGYQVEMVDSGIKALEKISAGTFSAVLCDVTMPGMNGIKTLTEIKKINNTQPVIMMSGLADHDVIITALEKGAIDFIAKPIDVLQLNQTVKKVITDKTDTAQEGYSPFAHLLREGYLGLLKTINQLYEAKTPYLKEHSNNVMKHADKIAHALKLADTNMEVIHCAAMLHDIGKINVTNTILTNKGKLSEQEWADMKMHPTTGRVIVEQLKLFRAEEPLIQFHHERYDGTGYPRGLTGIEIPLGARIIAVADAYDAMTSDRSYRQAMSPDAAKNILKEQCNKQFDPEIVQAFFNTI